jgi:hypothetical protein
MLSGGSRDDILYSRAFAGGGLLADKDLMAQLAPP